MPKPNSIQRQKRKLKPGIGVGIFLINPITSKLLIGRRIKGGLFGLPGGWLEIGEEWNECASRELQEETGLIQAKESFSHVYTLNSVNLEHDYHSISCVMYSEVNEEEKKLIKNMEPDKCFKWFWASVDELKRHYDKLFYPLRTFLDLFPEMKDVSYIKKLIKNRKINNT